MKTTLRQAGAALFLAALIATMPSIVAQTAITTTSTANAGTITEFSPDTIVLRSETSPTPVRYRYSKTTTYVDEMGAPVSVETVKSGLPVTVEYVRDGDEMVASKVIVRKTVTKTAPVIEEKKTTTTTTTTTR